MVISVVESSTILSRSSPVSGLVSTFGAFKDTYDLSCHEHNDSKRNLYIPTIQSVSYTLLLVCLHLVMAPFLKWTQRVLNDS